MTQIIGVTGFAQHGKSSVVARLAEQWGFSVFNFADPLKSMAVTLDPFIPHEDHLVAHSDRLSAIVRDLGWEDAKKISEVRRFLQVLGTEGVRGHLGEQAWVQALAKAVKDSGTKNVAVGDVRFPNEAAWVHANGGKVIRVVRMNAGFGTFDNGVGKNHPSEKFIEGLPYDYRITARTGELDRLIKKVDRIMGQQGVVV